MALHDWNQDGKKDMRDNYIEYNIYNNSTGKDSMDFNGSDLWTFVKAAGVILLILLFLGSCAV